MAMMTRRMAGASAIAFLLTASMVAAQAPASVRVRATITSVDSGTLTAKARDGGEMTIKLADNAPVNEVVKAPLSDIKEGSYLAITASPQSDGSQKAMAILIFPPGVHPAEGFSNWDLPKADSCTAANNMAAASRIRCNAGFAGIISALGLAGLLCQ